MVIDPNMMTEKIPGVQIRTTLFLWTLAAILTWITFHGVIWAFQIAILKFKHELDSTALEGILFVLLMFIVIDFKIILATVLSWGLLYYFIESINDTMKNMILSISIIFLIWAGTFLYSDVTNHLIEKDRVLITSAPILMSLLVPRLIFKKLKPGKIRKHAS